MLELKDLRTLKGAPISILFALFFAHQPVGESWLVTVTGYSQNTVRRGCEYLEEIGYALRNGRYDGWVLANGTVQLPLPTETLKSGESKIDSRSTYLLTAFNRNKVYNVNSEQQASNIIQGESKIDSRILILDAAGIKNPKKSEILNLKWASENYLKSMIEEGKRKNQNIGLTIHKIMCHDPMPKNINSQDPDSYRQSWLGVD